MVTVQKACYFFCDLNNLSFFSYTQTIKVWCKMYKAGYKTRNGLRHVYCLLEELLCLLMDVIVIKIARGELGRVLLPCLCAEICHNIIYEKNLLGQKNIFSKEVMQENFNGSCAHIELQNGNIM